MKDTFLVLPVLHCLTIQETVDGDLKKRRVNISTLSLVAILKGLHVYEFRRTLLPYSESRHYCSTHFIMLQYYNDSDKSAGMTNLL